MFILFSDLITHAFTGSHLNEQINVTFFAGTTNAFSKESSIPIFLQADDIIDLFQQVANGFMAIIEVQHGQMIQLSNNVKKYLGFYQEELLHKSIFDLLHPRDVDVFKKQILCRREFQACGERCGKSCNDEEHQCTSEPAAFSCWPDWNSAFGSFSLGSRRVFFCRLKCRLEDQE
ncbi:unnamed protein product [Soboliphyme baturini]|uniref:PAS domain-containing protein n=1 Tax=Soboliphyme baturini TaxID=241478 RepID=A0A3P8F0S2_9BILA|nr:unnamed protein product [Soboliphyme baturini]